MLRTGTIPRRRLEIRGPCETMITETDWRTLNRANWDERVDIHINSDMYRLERLRAGDARLHPLEARELGSVDGLDILHLQCHFGKDSLVLAQLGARVTGLDFSAPAIAKARELAEEFRLADRATFVEADVYKAPQAIGRPHSFDRVYVTWGTICWLPDIPRWAEFIGGFLEPGGFLYFLDSHPAALVFDDDCILDDGMPGYFVPYLGREMLTIDDDRDYADSTAKLQNVRTCEWVHPVSDVVTSLIDAGLQLDWLHEHDGVPWAMFSKLVRCDDGYYRWPDQPWLPLAYSLKASKPT